MSTFGAMHSRYEKVMRRAIKEGRFIINCQNIYEAKKLRVAFYNYFRYLKTVVERRRPDDMMEWQNAVELLEMKDRLSLKCHGSGAFELRIRDVMQEMGRLDKALKEDSSEKLPTHEMIMRELGQVEDGECKDIWQSLRDELG